jgi:membrane protease YdiL (CAAX protease family)
LRSGKLGERRVASTSPALLACLPKAARSGFRAFRAYLRSPADRRERMVDLEAVFRDETGRFRTVWRFLWFGVVMVVAFLLFSLAAGVLFGMLVPRFVRHAVERDPLWAQIILVPALAVLVWGIVCVFRVIVDMRRVESMGMIRPERRPSASPWVGLGIGALAAAVPIVAFLALGLFRDRGGGISALTVLSLPMFLTSAFAEELVFRGYLLRNMMDVGWPRAGILLTSVLFALWHALSPGFAASPVPVLTVAVTGVALGVAYVLSSNLWFATALHFAWNAVQGTVFGLPVSGISVPGAFRLAPVPQVPEILTGGAFGLQGSVAGTASITLGAALLLMWLVVRMEADQAEAGAPAGGIDTGSGQSLR